MLPQLHLIQRVKDLCRSDDRIDAAMMYGSFTYGEADVFSDIEFLLYFHDEMLPDVDQQRAWLAQVAPVRSLFINEHGITAVILQAPNGDLIRGEFHFDPVSKMPVTESWRGVLTFPSLDSTLIVDKSGKLTPYLAPIIGPPLPHADRGEMQWIADSFINWALFGINVQRRGEYARALELLNILHRHLIQMVRVLEDATDHWLTPARLAEQDLSPDAYARLKECTATLDAQVMGQAYDHMWAWGVELLAGLREKFGIAFDDDLCVQITTLVKRDQEE